MSHQNLNLYTVLLLARASKDPRLQGRGRLLNPCTKQNVRMRRLRTYQRWKQLQADHPHNKQKFYGLSHYAPTFYNYNPTNRFRSCSHLQYPHPHFLQKAYPLTDFTPFDHYDFLLPRDQIIGLLLDNSLYVEIFTFVRLAKAN